MDKVREKLPPLAPRRAVQRQPAVATHHDGEDEQVEKFYALLDNIRVEKHLFQSRRSNCRKRSRMEEPPWKPMFTMQDFEEAKGDDVGDPSKIAASGSGETTEGRGIGHSGVAVEAKEIDLRLTLSLG